MNFEIKPDTAVARHPVTNEKLMRDDGTYVPLRAHVFALHLDGCCIAWVRTKPTVTIQFLYKANQIEQIHKPAADFVYKHFGSLEATRCAGGMNQPYEPTTIPAETENESCSAQ